MKSFWLLSRWYVRDGGDDCASHNWSFSGLFYNRDKYIDRPQHAHAVPANKFDYHVLFIVWVFVYMQFIMCVWRPSQARYLFCFISNIVHTLCSCCPVRYDQASHKMIDCAIQIIPIPFAFAVCMYPAW